MMIDREDDEEDVEHDNNNFEDGSDDSNDFVHCENCKGLILFTVRIAGVDVQLGLFVCSLAEHSTYILCFVIVTFRWVWYLSASVSQIFTLTYLTSGLHGFET